MKKLMIVAVCTAIQFASAAEFGAAVEASGAAVVAEQSVMEEAPLLGTSDASAIEELEAFIARQLEKDPDYAVDMKDRKRNRFIVKEKIQFSIRSQDVGTKYLDLREGMMSLLLLKAKVKLARLRTGRIDAKRLSVDDDETTTLTRELTRLTELEMVGTTVLEQYESCQKDGDRYICQIAILMSWSKESENVAKAIQLAFSDPKAKAIQLSAGKNSVNGWVYKKKPALGEWLGPRRYVDKNGEVWLLGIAAAPYERNDRRNDKRINEARMLAEAEVAWSLYGDVKMGTTINKTMSILSGKDLDDLTDDEKATFGRKFAMTMSEETSMETAGMIYPFEGVVKDASGQKVNVVVAGISIQSKRDMLKDLRDSEDVARQVKAGRDSERGAREAKIGNPRKSVRTQADSADDAKSVAKPSATRKGRLATGVRHFSSDDE